MLAHERHELAAHRLQQGIVRRGGDVLFRHGRIQTQVRKVFALSITVVSSLSCPSSPRLVRQFVIDTGSTEGLCWKQAGTKVFAGPAEIVSINEVEASKSSFV
ncbi:MAG: hypothetical protein AAGI72_07905 [Pseudomonadota bacterium]